MDFNVKSGLPEKQRTACVVVGIFEPRRLSETAERLDEVSEGFISNIIRRGDLEGKLGHTLLLHNLPNTLCERVLLVGCGREREFSDTLYRKLIAKTTIVLNEIGAMESVNYLTELSVKGRNLHWKLRQAVESARAALYRFDQFKSEKKAARRPLRKVTLTVPSRRELADGESAIQEGIAIAEGVAYAKNLANLPANICTPTYLAEQSIDLAKQFDNISTTIIDPPEMEKLGMGALLAVAKGAVHPAKLIVIEYRGGNKNDAPIALVGKGVTFDSGGISLKPAAGMDEMKYDMCGAAAVLGTLTAIATIKLPINVVCLVPATENLPSGDVTKPGDIVTSMSGKTIEILNTDAEGRLILCDALTYCERFQPKVIIDVATLTGACLVALGRHISGLLGNHHPLIHDLLNAGKISGDQAWELPMGDAYQQQLKSPFADLANIGGREAGTITAACFLANFTKKHHWAHLDIAGTAWRSGDKKGATGRPVPLLTQYLIDQCRSDEPATNGKGS
ncbi:MAG: leucyl aminopeptidase [Gammaproteobacteria bacterium]|nr:leucyl aminopeptidase [Gammaproteobacteria bacterium]